MIIIAFAPNSSKILPNILCKKFKHCAVIVRNENKFTMYQFVAHRHVEKIVLRHRDIGILATYGWHFVYIPRDIKHDFDPDSSWTCVGMTKHAIGICAPWILTPYALYKHIHE
jgi:hypothetical protein